MDWGQLRQELVHWTQARVRTAADAEDLVQAVLLRLWRRPVTTVSHFRGLAWQSTKNAVVDYYRRQQRDQDRKQVWEGGALPVGDEQSCSKALEDLPEDLTACLPPLLKTLPESYREALEMTELGAYTQKQAAENLGLSVSGMKSRVQRGRVLLKASFDQCCQIEADVFGQVVECTPRSEEAARMADNYLK